MRTFTRLAYGFILQLHPHEFRAEFGEEMLWIFDEQMRCGESGVGRVVLCAQLLLDAAHSACIARPAAARNARTADRADEFLCPLDSDRARRFPRFLLPIPHF
jgi:hypothetical protein